MIETEQRLTTATGEVPALVIAPEGPTRAPAVLFYHGLRAHKEVHQNEGRALARAGLAVFLIDAPHHGARQTGLVDPRGNVTGTELDRLLIRLVQEGAAEVPGLVDAVLAAGHPCVAIAGISMGAYIALAAGVLEPRLAAIASLLGSPDWTPQDGMVPADMTEAIATDPMHLYARLVPRPLLLINGGRDVNVRPEGARRLAALLGPLYAAVGAGSALVLCVYAEADHFPDERGWHAMWTTTVEFLLRSLRP